MKAKFKNIGPIKQADLELGNLTIIAGQNNTGKTYLVYTLYGFLAMLKKREFPLGWTFDNRPLLKKVENIANDIKAIGLSKIDSVDYAKLKALIEKGMCSHFSSHHINDVFSSPNGAFPDAGFFIKTESENKQLKNGTRFTNSNVVIQSSFEDEKLILELKNPDNEQLSSNFVKEFAVIGLLERIIASYPNAFILSAERFGISLFYKELDFTKNRLVEELQKLSDKKEFEPVLFIDRHSARYAKPIKDNIDFTRDLSNIQKKKSDILKDDSHSVKKIMDGYYKVKNDEIRFISNRRGENRFDIPLHLASSSARGVSDLYFYLNHVAQSGQILIVDEPESHLSPTNQVMMARLLAFCVNAGLKVLITTHSDYLIKELNNLIMLSGDFEGKVEFLQRHRSDYSENDRLDPKAVKAYICDKGTLKPCSVDSEGIDMPVFDKAIDKINKISMELSLLAAPDSSQDD